MRPIPPNTGAPEITIAKDQPAYLPIVAAEYKHPNGYTGLLTRWEMTEEERQAVVDGADIYLMQMPFGNPMQPIKMQVGPSGYLPEDLKAAEEARKADEVAAEEARKADQEGETITTEDVGTVEGVLGDLTEEPPKKE